MPGADPNVNRPARGDRVERRHALVIGVDAYAEPALRLGGATGDSIAANIDGMARALLGLGRAEAAIVRHREALAITEPMLGPDNVLHAAPLCALALALIEVGRIDEAQASLERALRLVTARPYDPHVEAEVRLGLARALATTDPGRSRVMVDEAEALVAGETSPRAQRVLRTIADWRSAAPRAPEPTPAP